MDIAKIRKKIKEESEIRRGEKQQSEDGSHLSACNAQAEGSEVKPQPHVPAQVVSESLQIGTESVSKPVPEGLNQGAAKPVVDSTLREEAISPSERQTGIVELLTFQLAAEEFAFRISEVEEIFIPQQITMVPKAPDYILGITSVRGKVMPVLDLKKRL
ncbi:MAG: chemotaxis protein CheW, partial [Nitrospirota bacterium]|nr:chemotaxis protein CheW [Nitrospirota bacterium]